LPSINFAEIPKLAFESPDFERFPNLAVAYKALKKGGTAPAVLSASNEIAVKAFLDGKVRLSEIAQINEKIVGDHQILKVDSLKSVLSADRWARTQAEAFVSEKYASTSLLN
jgi:1-deoxy-D-xylulose-5-phosphate reductoisomerase